MKSSITYSLATAAIIVTSATFIYAGGCGTKSASACGTKATVASAAHCDADCPGKGSCGEVCATDKGCSTACPSKQAAKAEGKSYAKACSVNCGAEKCADGCVKAKKCKSACGSAKAASQAYSTINTESLKALVASGESVVIVDARSGKYDDGRRIPGAISLAADASKETIKQALPDKGAKIVAYCSSEKCPASANLAKRLVKYGYSNVHKYPEGIAGWTASGNTVTTVAAK